jgi:hypothetical protein
MAIEPAAISARPAVTIMPLEAIAPVSPAASAKGNRQTIGHADYYIPDCIAAGEMVLYVT